MVTEVSFLQRLLLFCSLLCLFPVVVTSFSGISHLILCLHLVVDVDRNIIIDRK